MERLHGRSVRQLLDECGALPGWGALGDGGAGGAALGWARAAGVVHRDVKPSNVFVLDDGRAKLLDFGLARAALARGETDEVSLTQSGVVCGTPAYLAPEVVL